MFSKIILATVLATTTVSAFAYKEKNARANDVASKYILDDRGTLSRIVNGRKCDITTKVNDFKVSSHKHDVAMIYFDKADKNNPRITNLHLLRNVKGATGQCPKADQGVLVSNIKKYTVVSNASSETLIVNLTLDKAGKLIGWDNNRAVITASGIKNYVNNDCFGSSGKSFSSYVAFGITHSGKIVKIKGSEIDKKVDPRSYSDIEDFKIQNRVCN